MLSHLLKLPVFRNARRALSCRKAISCTLTSVQSCMQVDGAVIGTTPLVPVNETSQTPLAHIVKTSSDGISGVPAQSTTSLQRSVSFAAVGRSVFSYTFLAPSTPGTHTIAAVAVSGGMTTPIAAPLVRLYLLSFSFVLQDVRGCSCFCIVISLPKFGLITHFARPSRPQDGIGHMHCTWS